METVTKLRICRVILFAAIGYTLSIFNVPFGGMITILLLTVFILIIGFIEGVEYDRKD